MATRKIDGKWYVDIRIDGRRYRKKSPEDSRKGAQAYERLLRQRHVRGEGLVPKQERRKAPKTYKAFAHEWMQTFSEPRNKPSSIKSKRCVLNKHLLPFFGRMSLERINAQAIDKYVERKVMEGLSNKTVNNHLTVLNSSLKSAVEWKYLERAPSIRWLPTSKPKIQFLSDREVRSILADMRATKWNLMAQLILGTGMRIGEVLALHWEDIDLVYGTVCVRYSFTTDKITPTKNNKIRTLPLTNELVSALRDWGGQKRLKKGDVVFGRGKQPIRRDSTYGGLRALCKRAGVRRIGWHTLRHTFATRLCARGVSLRTVQELMGHSSITVTERYMHVDESMMRHAVNSLASETIQFGQYMGSDSQKELVHVRPMSGREVR